MCSSDLAGWLLLVLVAAIPKILSALGGYRSASWPFTEAVVTTSKIESYRQRRSTLFRLIIGFHYEVSDKTYQGSYIETFYTADEAQKILRSLLNGPTFVRYFPSNPSVHHLDPYRDVAPVILKPEG